MAEKTKKEIAAIIYGCKVDDLMGFRELDNGGLSIIAPTGQKFVYPAAQVEAKRAELAAKARPKRRTAQSRTAQSKKRKALAKPSARPAAAKRRQPATPKK